jgi:hypothetical protein
MPVRDSGGWDEYQRLVLSELERLAEESARLKDRLDVMTLQVWAAVGSLLAVLIGIIIKLILGG